MKTKNRMRKAGFTLVELIVVIAVLGILGAGAAVGYSGYVKKAAKAADEQLVSQIKYALEVAYVADPSYSGAAAVVLSKDAEANVTGEADSAAVKWVNDALTNAFGANWKNELKLEYDGWNQQIGNSLAVFSGWGAAGDTRTAALKALVTEGEGKAVPSFANEVDELYDLIEATSIYVSDKLGQSGVELLQGAANTTVTSNVTGLNSAEGFATAWASSQWGNGFMNNQAYGDGDMESKVKNNNDYMAAAVANAAVVKARNTSIATYLEKQNVPKSVCDFIANYSCAESGYLSNVPKDFYSDSSFESKLQEKLTAAGITTAANEWIREKITKGYWGATVAVTGEGKKQQIVITFPSDDALKKTQAYKDGLAYYAMMDTIKKTSETAGSTDDTYWSDMRSAVSAYGQIASGKLTLESLRKLMNGNESAMIIVTPDNGQLKLISTIETE